eukprot:snap_masked-scaffold_120-processed-gene-0.19-mRNA-1 protein AED:1.00 eAED:1.00 QI:0/0/0/0/1/1/2/0/63
MYKHSCREVIFSQENVKVLCCLKMQSIQPKHYFVDRHNSGHEVLVKDNTYKSCSVVSMELSLS